MSAIPVSGKKVTILGLGVSGFETAIFLKEKGFSVFVTELSQTAEVTKRACLLQDAGVNVETGKHDFQRILNSDWMMISPGIPPASELYQRAIASGKPVLSEIEVASWVCPTKKIIGVTGTCGKTTTVTLISRVLNAQFGKTVCCGNIGNPWIGEMKKITPEHFVVVEISSFQLAHCLTFKPFIGILLNLSANHQDWHPDMADYAAAKLKMFENQDENNFAIYREVDREVYFPFFSFKAQEEIFGRDKIQNPNEEVVRLTAKITGCSSEVTEKVLSTFEGVEHRLEKFHEASGVQFINDSKCTTTASLGWALSKFSDKKVILIAGGHPKSNDFHLVKDLIRQKVKRAILIGEAEPLLCQEWEGLCPITSGGMNFDRALESAVRSAANGDIVLLSPACASFDMFKNYIERGKLFKQKILELTSHHAPIT